jgi:hypothetical protein
MNAAPSALWSINGIALADVHDEFRGKVIMNECELMEDRVFCLEELIASLYLARRYADKKRITRAAVRVGVGPCELLNEHDKSPCWHSEPDKWCEACAQVQPFHESYHAASSNAGAVLRRVLREGRRLVEEKETKT